MNWNWSGIPVSSFLGKVLRFPLKLIPREAILPILQGRLRGLKWIAGSLNHGCWLGSYEYEKRRRFEQLVKGGSSVYDIGANVGYYSLLASVLAGEEGIVYAFEPCPENVVILRKHLEINKITNVIIFEKAVYSKAGSLCFALGSNPSTGHVTSESSDCMVSAIVLDSFVRDGNLRPPDVMKLDVEGNEYETLLGAEGLIRQYHPIIFLATHTWELHGKCCSFLRKNGYRLLPTDDRPVEASDEILAVPAVQESEIAPN